MRRTMVVGDLRYTSPALVAPLSRGRSTRAPGSIHGRMPGGRVHAITPTIR